MMSKAEQEEAKAFHKGVEAMREYLAMNMEKHGKARSFSGEDIAVIIRRVAPPTLVTSPAT